MRRRQNVLLLGASAALLALVACTGGPGHPSAGAGGSPDSSPEQTGAGNTAGSPGRPAGDGKPDASIDGASPGTPSGRLRTSSSLSRIHYVERPFAAIGCFDAKEFTLAPPDTTMEIATCPPEDDAGVTRKDVTVDPAGLAELLALYDALVEDTAAATAPCDHYDGTSLRLEVSFAGEPDATFISSEFNCSGPRPDVQVKEAGFMAFRKKAYELAGLPVPPMF